MLVADRLHDAQSQPAAFVDPVARGPREPLEELRLKRDRDARAAVLHPETVPVRGQADGDEPVLGRRLDRVRDQVGRQPPDALRVQRQGGRGGCGFQLHTDMALGRVGLDRFKRVIEQREQRRRMEIRAVAVFAQLLEIEDVAGHALDGSGVALRDLEELAALLGQIRLACGKKAESPVKRRNRILQLVADGRDQRVLGALEAPFLGHVADHPEIAQMLACLGAHIRRGDRAFED